MFSHLEKNLYLQYSHRYNNSFSELIGKTINSTNNIKENYFRENYLYISTFISRFISNYIKTYDIMEIFSHMLIIYVLIYIFYYILYYIVIILSFLVSKLVKLIYYPFRNDFSKQIKNNRNMLSRINNSKYNNSKAIEKQTDYRLEIENNSIGNKYIRRRSLRLIELEKKINKESPF